MAGPETTDDDEFPPQRPFGVPARPAPPEPAEDDDGAMPPDGGAGSAAGRAQPPATRS
jgi:hypothetical protein